MSPRDSAAAGREPLEGDDHDQVKDYRDRRDWEDGQRRRLLCKITNVIFGEDYAVKITHEPKGATQSRSSGFALCVRRRTQRCSTVAERRAGCRYSALSG